MGEGEWSVGLCLEYVEYDVHRKAWSFLDMAAEDDPILAASIVESEAEVGTSIRTTFTVTPG